MEKIINNMVIEQVLSELNEMERNIIVMRYFQDKTQTEIAKKIRNQSGSGIEVREENTS